MKSDKNSVPFDVWVDQMSREDADEVLKRLVRNSPGFFYRCCNDQNWTMKVLSSHFESITGYSPDELVGEDGLQYLDLIVEADRDRVRKAVETGLEKQGRFQVSYQIETASGERRWVLEHGSGAQEEAGKFNHIEGFVSDITREKAVEHHLRHSQKLEVIGRLAGGVAHDFNNLLSVIIGYASLALEQIDDMPGTRKDLAEVIGAADRAKELSGELLSFSRYQVRSSEVVDVDAFLREKISIIARTLGKDIRVERDLDAQHSCVEIAENRLEQVLLNLATNARDAMLDSDGTLYIRSRVEYFDAGLPAPAPVDEPGKYVVIDCQDNGEGIAPDVRDKIFDPFYTTKSKGHGTGLGLATSAGIITSAHGNLWFDTTVGEGTTFHIALPVTERKPSDAPKPKRLGRARVLIVDDDAKVRELIARLLRSESIDPVTTENADGARRLWASEDDFDMIIANVLMPGTDGITLVNELLSPSDRDIPVLYLSGYRGERVDDIPIRSRHVRFFMKPFTPETLRVNVTEMLGLEDASKDR